MSKKLFKPDDNLMSQLSELTADTAKQWYKEYLTFHKGVDQGIEYCVGYFANQKHAKMLIKAFYNK